MGVTLWIWPTLIGLVGLLAALPVYGRGDTFEADPMEEQDEVEARNPSDDILDINQELILREAPESSFLMEGDIIKASPFRLFFSANPRWPKKRGTVQIPYIISYRYDKSSVKIIQEAFEDFARLTCVKFVPYSYQRDFVSIAPLSGCFSSVGRVGGMQVVSLAPACLHRGKGVALHELMHVLGFWHEHSRADRDEYISISWDEILTGFEMNFMKSWNTNMLADYDYASVMHYGRNAFSMTGLPTIVPLSGSSISLGQRWNLSDSDIVRVNKLYKCSQFAAQPETSTERGIREKMRDFIPSEPQPCSTVSKVESSTAGLSSTIGSATEPTHPTQETLEAIVSSRHQAVGEGISIPEDQMRITWSPGKENQTQTMRSPKTSDKETDKRMFPAATEKMLLETPSREMKSPTMGSPVKKTSVTLLSSASRTSELLSHPPSDQESYLTSEESHPRSRAKTAAETELMLPFVTEGSVPFSSDIVQGATRSPGREEVDEELSGTKRVTSLKRSIALSTALEMAGSLGTGSSEFEGTNGSTHQTKGYSVSVTENYYKEQRKDMVHPAMSTSGNETGYPTHTFPMEDIQTIVMSPSYRASASRVSTNLAPLVEVGEETLGYEATGFSNVPIQTEMVEEVVESSDSNKGSTGMPPSMGSTSETNQDTTNKYVVPSSNEVLPLARVEAPENHLGWATSGLPSLTWPVVTATVSESHGEERGTGASMEAKSYGTTSLWRLFSTESLRSPLPTQPGHFAPSRLKEGSISWGNPAGHYLEEEPFSRTSAHWGKKGVRRVAFTQSTPSGSAFMKTKGQTFPDHVELSSQISTSGKWTLPSMKSHQVTSSTEGGNLSWPQSHKAAGLRATVSQPQSSNKEGFSPTAFSVGWASSGDGQREKTEHVVEEAFIGRGEKPSTEPRVSESHGEEAGTGSSIEAKTHGKAPFWRLFSTESFRSPLPTQSGHWVEENQRSRSPTLVRETNRIGEGQSQILTQSPGLGTMVPLRPCGPTSGTKSSLMEGTAERKVSLAAHLKLGATSEESQGPENKGLSSALEEVTLPVTETGTHPRWATGSTNPRERERTGNYTVVLPEETSPASMSQLTQTVTSVGPSHISTTSVLTNPTLKASPSSSPFWGAEPVTSSQSPAPPALSPAPEIKIDSKSNVTIQPAGRRHPQPGNVREEKFIQATEWVTRPTQEVTPGGNVAVSTAQPKLLPHVPTEGEGLLSNTSYLESSKFMHYRERSTSSHQRTESLPSAGEDVTVATTVASSAHLTTAIPLEYRASQANVSISSKLVTGSPSKKRGETTVETYTSTPVLVESHRIPSAVGSLLGFPKVMATIPQLQSQPQTDTELLEEFTWAPSGPKGTELILEGKEENLTLKSSTYASEISTAAVYTGVEAQGSRKKGLGGPSRGSGWQSSLPTNFKSVEKIENIITVHKEKETKQNFVTPSSKLHPDTSMTPSSNSPMMKMSTSVPGVQKTPATDKMDQMFPLVGDTEGMYLKEKESVGEATITLGTSQRHSPTSDSLETGFWSMYGMPHVTQGPGEPSSHSGFLLTKAMHVLMSSGEILPSSGQIPETSVVAKVGETTGNHRTGMRDFSEDKPDSLHHVVKRSFEKMVRSNAGYLSPKKMRLEKESSKEGVLRRTLMATSAGFTHHMPIPGTFKRDVDGPHVGHKDGTFPEEHVAKAMEPAKATLVSASQLKALTPLHHRLLSNMAKARNDPKFDERTVKAAHSFFCSFEKGLCSWEQSKNDDLDWVLEKEEEMQVEDGTISGKPCRISGSHILLKPSGLVPVQKAVLISPILNGVGCIKFWYNTMEAAMGEINFYRKPLNSSEWHKVWSMKGNQDTHWNQVTVSIYEASELQQVALEGVVKRRPLEIDDLLICRKPCWRCYNPAPSILCKNQN